jgi:hypothetical protein
MAARLLNENIGCGLTRMAGRNTIFHSPNSIFLQARVLFASSLLPQTDPVAR